MDQKHTEIASIGEFGLIDRIRQLVEIKVDDSALTSNLVKGISDDAAVYRPTPGKIQLLTADAFAEGVHFDLTFTSLKHLGWKVMAANFSDIAAMGGIPRYATITLSLPKKISVEMIEEFYSGVALACRKYSCLLVGGDTTASMANTMISASVVGEADERCLRFRSGARPGEYVCVTGHLGASLAGLRILQREKKHFGESANPSSFHPNLEPYAAAVEKHLAPKPRLDLSRILAEQITIGAMIDISDGLSSDIGHICKASNVGATIHEHNLPIESVVQRIAAEFNESPTEYALHGGEEFELLFTISDTEFEKLEMLTNDVTIIGRVTERENGICLVREDGRSEALPMSGWNHFR